MVFFNVKYLIDYSGLLITFATVVFGMAFSDDIHGFVHPQSPKPGKDPIPSQEPEATETKVQEEIPLPPPPPILDEKKTENLDHELTIICDEDEMVDIEEEFERSKTPPQTYDISCVIGLFEAIEAQFVKIPGDEFASSIRYLMYQPYFNGFFKIENDALFKAKLESILNIIEQSTDADNTKVHIPECYQLFRSDEYKRINFALEKPVAQSPLTPFI